MSAFVPEEIGIYRGEVLAASRERADPDAPRARREDPRGARSESTARVALDSDVDRPRPWAVYPEVDEKLSEARRRE
jgi:hypothetical protein